MFAEVAKVMLLIVLYIKTGSSVTFVSTFNDLFRSFKSFIVYPSIILSSALSNRNVSTNVYIPAFINSAAFMYVFTISVMWAAKILLSLHVWTNFMRVA